MTRIVREDIWDLDASPGWLGDAAQDWRTLVTAFTTASSTTTAIRGTVECAWEGPYADAYLEYAPSLTSGIEELSTIADEVRGVLTDIEARLDSLQSSLTASYYRAVAGVESVTRSGGTVVFEFPDDENHPQIGTEYARAQELRDIESDALAADVATLEAAAAAAEGLAGAWNGPANGNPAWNGPSGAGFEPLVLTSGGTTTVITGNGDTGVVVTIDPETGDTILLVSYLTDSECILDEIRIPAGQDVVINTGRGNDTITVPPGLSIDLRLTTGAGADQVRAATATGDMQVFGGAGADIIETGSGFDFIDGGAGDDYVDAGDGDDRIFGGHGDDVLYGMGGDDVISGGAGHDYLEGGRGNDTLFGDDGSDILSGGFGDDTLHGGAGDDTIYAGSGNDTIDGGLGDNKITMEAGDTNLGHETPIIVEIPSEEYYTQWLEFEVDASDAFKERMLADLHMLASSEVGQAMIEQQIANYEDSGNLLGFGKKKVTFIEMDEQNGYATPEGNIRINPDYRGGMNNPNDPLGRQRKPPIIVLFHELGHINQLRTQGDTFGHWWDPDATAPDGSQGYWITDQNGQPLIERQNVGLDWDESLIPEGDGENYNWDFTENGFRDELRLPHRDRY